MVEGLFSLLFCSESGINQYTKQKTFTDVVGASLTTCYYLSSVALEIFTAIPFRNASSCFYEKKTSSFSQIISLVFCSVQYMKKSTFLDVK